MAENAALLKCKVGFIGGGNMSYAVAMGIVKGGAVLPNQVLISNRTAGKLDVFKTEGMQVTLDNIEVLKTCDVIFLGVKPFIFPVVVEEINNRGSDIDLSGKIFVSLMGGISMSDIEKALGMNTKIVRTLPNTPCLCLSGTIMITKNRNLSDEEYAMIKNSLSVCAACYDSPEKNFGPASAIMGCSPAYFFIAIEALADGGVMHGVPRALAIELAARAVAGAGKLALEAGKHTEELKDAVASPAGTTIRGLYALEKAGFRAALIDAVHATCTPLKK